MKLGQVAPRLRNEKFLLLGAVATFTAIAFLALVHRTILAGRFAVRLVCRKRNRANCCEQNREEDFRAAFHIA
jgi:hypothetical protein